MKITNQNRGTLLAREAILADTSFKRIQGLLGKERLDAGCALILKPCNSIHTFFMRFAIDVLFVDKNARVIKAISSLKPFRITPVYINSALAIELPSGAIASTQTVEGDAILIDI